MLNTLSIFNRVSVKVDTARLEAGQFKKCCMECVLLYYPSTEFQSTFNVYWHGEGAAGLSSKELSIWEFPSLRGGSWKSGSIVYDIVWRRCSRRTPWMMLRTPVCSYPIIVTHLSFKFLCLLLLYSIYLNVHNKQKQEFKTNPTQLSQLSGVARLVGL